MSPTKTRTPEEQLQAAENERAAARERLAQTGAKIRELQVEQQRVDSEIRHALHAAGVAGEEPDVAALRVRLDEITRDLADLDVVRNGREQAVRQADAAIDRVRFTYLPAFEQGLMEDAELVDAEVAEARRRLHAAEQRQADIRIEFRRLHALIPTMAPGRGPEFEEDTAKPTRGLTEPLDVHADFAGANAEYPGWFVQMAHKAADLYGLPEQRARLGLPPRTTNLPPNVPIGA